jgi:glycosyltransferase involved in cell wall biosynthesis
MRLAYVLDRPELCGGVKVAFQHAQILHALGHRVTVLAAGERPAWIRFDGDFVDTRSGPPALPPQDLLIATYWTTIEVAERLDRGPVAHFCQGYEGDLPHLEPVRSQIEEIYRRPLPTLVAAPHLGELVHRRFGRQSRLAPPPLDPRFRPAWRWRPHRRPWVMICGLFESHVKGIPLALTASTRLREAGLRHRLLRVSTWPLSESERQIRPPDRYLCHVAPRVVARAMRRCDLLLFTSGAAEGFGLPVLEAMAAGVPVVASTIPSLSFMGADALALVPPGDAHALADAARRLLTSPADWRAARRRGRVAARAFAASRIAGDVTAAVDWAARASRAPRVLVEP